MTAGNDWDGLVREGNSLRRESNWGVLSGGISTGLMETSVEVEQTVLSRVTGSRIVREPKSTTSP